MKAGAVSRNPLSYLMLSSPKLLLWGNSYCVHVHGICILEECLVMSTLQVGTRYTFMYETTVLCNSKWISFKTKFNMCTSSLVSPLSLEALWIKLYSYNHHKQPRLLCSRQLLLPNCIHFSCFYLIVSTSAAAPWLHPLVITYMQYKYSNYGGCTSLV